MFQAVSSSLRIRRFTLSAFVSLALIAAIPGIVAAAPPVNDNFLNAITISSNALPFSDSAIINEATTESGEPFACSFSFQTTWYKITPVADIWLAASGSGTFDNVSAYLDSGGQIFTLQFVSCSRFSNQALFLARAGATYYLQVAAPCCGVTGSMGVTVQQVSPPVPIVNFSFFPSDPSTFDQVQFFDNSFDPGQVGIAMRHYDFGDGSSDSSASSCCLTHVFAADGDYIITLTVTTSDGRSASGTRPITVQTHDVAISNLKVPQTANVGQTKQLSVSVTNARYPETVRVELQKGVPGSFFNFQTIGTLEQFVPVRGKIRGTAFAFSYTPTVADGALGKVTFRAVATLTSSRDALFADNEAISSPVKINTTVGHAAGAGLEPDPGADPEDLAPLRVSPNPARAGTDLAIRLSLATEGEASVQVLDIAGRVMASRDLGLLPAGVHDARVAWQQRPAPGMYWVRLAVSGQPMHTLRLVVLD